MSGGHKASLVEGLLHSIHDKGVHIDGKPIIYCFIAANFAFLTIAPGQVLKNFEVLMLISPIWLPIVLGHFAITRWISANRIAWLAKQEYVLLEIRVPRDVRKTPLAMETVFTSMHLSPGESTWWKKFVLGAVRPWWSFEIVSLGGRVHLYAWTRVGFRRGLESYLYAQYPGVEVVEATDYSLLTDPTHPPYNMWGAEYAFTQNVDVLPLRTYLDFMKPDAPLAKPEEQIDPLAQVIEIMGSISPKEQFWVQILVRVHKGEKFETKRTASGGKYTIRDQASEKLEALRKQTVTKTSYVDAQGNVRESESFPNPTRGIQNTMEAIDRKVSKPLFDVNMRAVYLAPEDVYQGSMISHLIGLWKPFGSETLNALRITRWQAEFNDWPWEDPGGHHEEHLKHQFIDSYRRRSAFHEPYRLPHMVMNSEELATLFHIPSSGVTTPSLPRIQSSTAEAPSNLPT